jgi:hypothetical protein
MHLDNPNQSEQVFIHRPRIAELREAIIAGLPCKPSVEKVARKELRTLTLSSLLVKYLNWAHRFIPMRKRLVEFVPGFWASSVAQSYGGNILDLAGRIERGEDLTRFLSDLIHERGYVPSNVRQSLPAQERRWRDKDFALNALGVHHLHVSHPPTSVGAVRKGNEIVFVDFAPDYARFVLAGTHDDFGSEQLATAVARMRALMGFTVNGLSTREPTTPLSDLMPVARLGGSFATQVDGQTVMLSLISSDGTSIFLMKQLRQIEQTLSLVEPKVDDCDWVRALYEHVRLPMPSSPSFEWVLDCTALHLREQLSGAVFNVVPGYR